MTNEEKMAKRIYLKRTEYKMTMEELGNIVGVQRSAVNKWEKGVISNIKRSTIQKMAEVFNVSPAWLMGLEDDENCFNAESGVRDAKLLHDFHQLTLDHQAAVQNLISALLQSQ